MPAQMALSKQRLAPESAPWFFKSLPRELRDQIYDLLTQEIEWEQLTVYTMGMCAPLLTPRLISHQFKREYDERTLQNNQSRELMIAIESLCFQPGLIRCPNLATWYTTDLRIDVHACEGEHYDMPDRRCDSLDYLPRHADWIGEFVTHLPRLRSIRVNMTVFYDSCIYDSLISSLQSITMNPQVVEVKLRPAKRLDLNQDSGDDTCTLATWRRQQGIVPNQEAFGYCMEENLLGSWSAISGGQGSWAGEIFSE